MSWPFPLQKWGSRMRLLPTLVEADQNGLCNAAIKIATVNSEKPVEKEMGQISNFIM